MTLEQRVQAGAICADCKEVEELRYEVIYDSPKSGPLKGLQLTERICVSCAVTRIKSSKGE